MVFPWIPLITAGLGIVGNIMGKKTDTTQTTAQTQVGNILSSGLTSNNSTASGTTNQNTTSTGTTTQSQTDNSSGRTTGNQVTSQTGEQGTQQSGESTGVRTGEVSRLDDATRDLLTTQVQDLLSSSSGTKSALMQQLSEVSAMDPNFDTDSFIKGIMDQASSVVASDLESGTGGLESRIGAGESSNSAAALLSAKLRGAAAANLSGIKAQATAQAADIASRTAESKTTQLGQITGQLQQGTNTLLNSLLSASQTESSTESGTTTSAGTTKSTTAGQTSESGTQTGTNTSTSRGATTGSEVIAGASTGTQRDNSITSQTQNTTDSTNQTLGQGTKEVDWTTLFKGLSGIFSTQF